MSEVKEYRLKTYWHYSKLPAWRKRLHRLMHAVGLNDCVLVANPPGWRCSTCGEIRRWKD